MATDESTDLAAEFAARVKELGDWRGAMLSRIRQLIVKAEPDVVEDVKWRKPTNPRGVPTWSMDGLICTGEVYKDKVKVTFAQGAALEDPSGLFNSSLEGKVRRALDLFVGDELDEEAFMALIREAAAHNGS